MENSRDRVLASLNHLQPDQIAIDFGGHRSSGIAAMAYPKLKKALGISTGDIYVYDMIQQLAIVETDVLDAVGADVVELGRGFLLSDSDWKDWELPDGTPCKIPAFINLEQRGADWVLLSDTGTDLGIMKKGCFFFEQINWPWEGKNPEEQDFLDIEEAFAQGMWTATPAPPGLDPLTDEGFAELAKGAEKLRESTDRAIIGLFGGNLFEVPAGVQKTGSPENGFVLSGIGDGDWVRFANVNFGERYRIFETKLSLSCDLKKVKGNSDIVLRFRGDSNADLKLDWIKFKK